MEALATASILTSSFVIVGQTFPDTIVTVFGILETTLSLGFMAGPAIGGGLYQLGGYGLPFWALGVCTCICGCASCALFSHQPDIQTVQSSSKTIWPLLRSLEVWLALQGIVVSLFAITVIEPAFAKHLQQASSGHDSLMNEFGDSPFH
ncbi:uncharacterized protein LOC124274205 [Haliotis rubra]|uniref:uncharacterized protein LOC124274205 n=1 Tax=Haliotis rubra TaxID=36100 RepID=UPI001EE5A752|nr:uncharacterized protein LOC124274205 [Haliotis rubra]